MPPDLGTLNIASQINIRTGFFFFLIFGTNSLSTRFRPLAFWLAPGGRVRAWRIRKRMKSLRGHHLILTPSDRCLILGF